MVGTGRERREGSARGAREKKPLECGKKGGERRVAGGRKAEQKWQCENGERMGLRRRGRDG